MRRTFTLHKNRFPGQNAASAEAKDKHGWRPRNYQWARLMARVFEFDVLACPRCGATMRILAAIDAPDAIRKILACLGLPTSPTFAVEGVASR